MWQHICHELYYQHVAQCISAKFNDSLLLDLIYKIDKLVCYQQLVGVHMSACMYTASSGSAAAAAAATADGRLLLHAPDGPMIAVKRLCASCPLTLLNTSLPQERSRRLRQLKLMLRHGSRDPVSSTSPLVTVRPPYTTYPLLTMH